MPPHAEPPLLDLLTTLGDPARLRVLRLLEAEELSVGELAKALQLPQSTVSRHLKLLHEAGWIEKRTAGTASLYCLDEASLAPPARDLWSVARRQLVGSPTFDQDDARLAGVVAERSADSKAFFGRIGGEWDEVRGELFGSHVTGEALLALLDPGWVVADLGCGTGNAAEHLAPMVRSVIAVDRETGMLDAARKRLKSFENVEFRQGELTSLPIDDAAIDAAIVSLVLHHVDDPDAAVREIGRALRPGGLAIIVDMVPHDREDYRRTMGHRHLGFDEPTVRAWAEQAGLDLVRYRRLRPDTAAKGPGLFVAMLRKG
jgi:ArsR family transcriptional regulator